MAKFEVGQTVIRRERNADACLIVVEKISATGQVTAGGERYTARGSLIGVSDSWSRPWIDIATTDQIDAVRKATELKRARSLFENAVKTTSGWSVSQLTEATKLLCEIGKHP